MFHWEKIVNHQDFKNIMIALGVFLILLLLRKLFTKYVYKVLIRLFSKTPTELFTQTLLAFERPVQWLWVLVGIYGFVRYFPYWDHTNPLFLKGVQTAIILLISWGLYKLTSATSIIFERFNKQTKFALDGILLPFISRALRFIILALTATVVLEIFDYSISGFVAGLGLGGLAFALAAQDVLANLFGGVVILIEKPFTKGDWIITPSVEGTVEEITFRSTKVRTLSLGLVTVPNATLSVEAITNTSRRDRRLASFHLQLDYDTPSAKVKTVVEQIRAMLEQHKDIHQETIYVTFDEYGENGVEVYLYFFTKTSAWGEYLAVKGDVNLRIMQILEAEDVFIALPNSVLYQMPHEEDGEREPAEDHES